MDKITYTYIPIENEDEGITQLLFSKENLFTNIMMIENAARGIYIDSDMKDVVTFTTKSNLEDQIKKIALDPEDYEVIMLNGFDISLDEVRDIYIDLAIKYDVRIFINVLTENVDANVSIHFDYAIKDLSDSQWEGVKNSAMEKVEKENLNYITKEKNNNKEAKSLLAELINLDKDKLNSLDDLTDLKIVESCVRTKDNEQIGIHKLEDNSILISDIDNEIVIVPEFIDFLKMSLDLLG